MPVVFNKTEQFDISRGNKLGVLPVLGRDFVISFQFMIDRFIADYPTLHSILHFNIFEDQLLPLYGVITPALMIQGRTILVVASAINGNFWKNHIMNFRFATKKWYTVEISQLSDDDGKASILEIINHCVTYTNTF